MSDDIVNIVQEGKRYYVTWSHHMDASNAGAFLADMCFKSCDADEVGLHDKATEQIMWISFAAWAQMKDHSWIIQSRRAFNHIDGVYLQTSASAEKLKQELEKLYLFWVLKES